MNRSLSLAFAIAASTCTSVAAQSLTVSEIEVRLFLAHTGSFSAPLPETFGSLWNTDLGEGKAAEPSTSSLVKVAVSGGPANSSLAKKTAIRLDVRNLKTKLLLSTQSKTLGQFSDSGREYAAFWLPNTGCTPLQLTATVSGSSKALLRVVPFACGE